ncbi:MAG: hypothetical protein WA040_23710 [Anaerolineae bacterium]|mgnify:CR=1 FL=1
MNAVQTMSFAQEDRRAKTILPALAAMLSLVAGAALAYYAYNSLQFPDAISKLIGGWNMVVVLAYLWLAYVLIRRQENAYSAGLLLSLGNIAFVFGQLIFWFNLSGFTDMPDEERFLILGVAPFVFMLTDALLAGGVFLSFRDLVPPMRPEDVPESDLLLERIKKAVDNPAGMEPVAAFLAQSKQSGISTVAQELAPPSQAELDQFLDIRRRFLASEKSNARGGAEINASEDGVVFDLIVKPLTSYFKADEGSAKREYQRYIFYPCLRWPSQLGAFEKASCHVIAITASKDVLDSLSTGIRAKTSLYVIREGVWKGKSWGRSNRFERFANGNYGLKFNTYK